MAGETPTDEALLRAAAAGDHGAFTALVHRHRDRVYAICLRFFREPADAQDATQEAFLAVHRGAASFDGRSKFTTWLYRVTTNACNDMVRKKVRRPQTVGFDPNWLGQADDDIANLELGMDLADALRTLTPPHREAVLLHSFHGYTYVEIAERTGAAVGTIKSRVHRGLAQIAEVLRDRGGMEPSGPPVLPSPDSPPHR